MNNNQLLLTPFRLKQLKLKNRIVMAPMTRSRAGAGFTATDLMAEYYAQRSSAGLIISEGSQISPKAVGYRNTPGIYSTEQIEAWKKVTLAVHNNHSFIFLQLWHVGRISHPDFLAGQLPLAPSPIKPIGKSITYDGPKMMLTPKEMTNDDIQTTIQQFVDAAVNAVSAHFDGVEIHAANNYLLQQFLCDATNKRTDKYGGSIANRSRFTLEIVEKVCNAVGNHKVGIKLSPSNYHYGTTDSSPVQTYDYLIKELNKFNLAYLHLQEPLTVPAQLKEGYLKNVCSHYRPLYHGTIITNGKYTREKGNHAINSDLADLVSFGLPFIANPDLPERFKLNADLQFPDKNTFYQGGEKGYTDYPFLK